MAEQEGEGTMDSSVDECHDLLMGLKSTVERLLAVQASNVWSTYGGFKRVSSQMEAILCHRIKTTQMFSPSDGLFWPFVRGLKWLRPGISSTMEKVSRGSRTGGQDGKGQLWLSESLQEHSLSSQLEILVSDPEHLQFHYQDGAFLRNEDYVQAMLLCLRAVELNKVVILSDINPRLLTRHKQESTMASRLSPLPSSAYQDPAGSGFDPSAHTMPIRGSWVAGDSSASPPNVASLRHRYSEPIIRSVSQSSDFRPVTAEDIASATARRSLSASPDLSSSSSVATLTSVSPLTSGRLEERVQSDPLMAQPFGTSPNYRVDTPVFHDSDEEIGPLSHMPPFTHSSEGRYAAERVNNENSDRDIPQKNPLRKCISESCDPNDSLETRLQSSHQAQYLDGENRTKKVEKKIHIPGEGSGSLPKSSTFGTWHGRQDLNSRTSDSKSSSAVKTSTPKHGHKRSQSDMGVGAASGRVVSPFQEVRNQGDVSGPSLGNSAAETGASSGAEKTVQRQHRASLHRGDSLFQPPAKGQSLMSYLSEQDFHCCAMLERENAHFAIADVLVGVFEQMKWETTLRRQSLHDSASDEEESDNEIYELKQRIRIRRRERLVEKSRRFPANSDGMDGTNTTDSLAASSPMSYHEFSSLSDASDHSDVDEQIELTTSGNETTNLARLSSSGLSLSLASLYSDADLQKNIRVAEKGLDRQSSEKSNFSAEAIAMSLLSQFSEKRLPKASELDWLVSEKDAPQALLPLPNSYPISPDDGENADLLHTTSQTKLRGNLEWAPPRPQIIFTVHPQEKRSVVLSRQNMRCAGCGTKTEPGFVKRLRYCEYMGKYFCQCCHGNDTEIIPGRVIMRWDFTRYSVSNFARDLLQKIHVQPLFHISAINLALYRKVRVLETIRDLRKQLGHLSFLLKICKRDKRLLEEMAKLPKHWIEDNDLYSMEDFSSVRSGQMLTQLKTVVADAISHVENCQLCHGLGFICEVCQEPRVIFPFQLTATTLCPVCHACYHKSCFIPGKCPKCSRMELRRKRQAQVSPTELQTSDSSSGGNSMIEGKTQDIVAVI